MAENSAIDTEKLLPVNPAALESSIASVDAFMDSDDVLMLTPEHGESIMLCMHELKRLRSRPTPAADEVEAVARAICDASQGEWRTNEGLTEQAIKLYNPDALNNHWRHKARAAIAALQDRSAEPASDPCKLPVSREIAAWNTAIAAGLSQDDAIARVRALPAEPAGEEPVAFRYVHLDYAGRKVSRYGPHPERVNGHDPIETHPLYARPAPTNTERLVEALRAIADLQRHSREDAAENAQMMEDIARRALSAAPLKEATAPQATSSRRHAMETRWGMKKPGESS